MARKKELTSEEKNTEARILLDSQIRDLLKKPCLSHPNQSRTFKVGDRVKIGALPNCKVVAIHDGRVYEVKVWGTFYKYGQPYEDEYLGVFSWIHCLPDVEKDNKSSFIQNDDLILQYFNMNIDSALSSYYNALDMNPSYQRDYVWSEEDKVQLIDSIFNNRDIGRYVIVKNGYDKELYYEILDGKQRINALVDFFEDKFQYKGKYFTELSYKDQHWFEAFSFPRAEINNNPSLELRIKIFIHINTSGKHMAQEHLEKVKGMLK